ncbi:hypothetical protein PS9374_04745 [Planomonospora sphaerica]|uniref:Uncharacterized protein n=1 Tax=Planomonospora sphaerica TaxID=161355 RepID=A0A171DJT9_9ACTN|nr:hypothetical protein [Planomonospora sphaerica]GAT69078.1 hypothetical protein PS9374_04745 [Planomonospora sphaerica]
MRTGYNEALALLGYVLGMVATSVLAEWARESGGESLSEVLLMCSLLFEVAFLFGLVRFFFQGLRWGGRLFARRWRTAASQAGPVSPGR